MKSIQWEPSFSMKTGGQTNKTKLILDFRNFPTAPKNWYEIRPRKAVVISAFQLYGSIIKFTVFKRINEQYHVPSTS